MYIDIDVNTWFEGELFRVVPLQVRKLKCGDVRVVKKYLHELRHRFEDRDLIQRVNWLYCPFNIPLAPGQIDEYERIDSMVTECCLAAERRCRKIRAGNVPFSPVGDQAAKSIYFWNLILSKRRGVRVSTKLIKRTSNKYGLIVDPATSTEEIRQLRNQAIKRYKELKPKAKERREEFIRDLADAIEEIYGTNRASNVRSLTI